jgi:hypothetical protein
MRTETTVSLGSIARRLDLGSASNVCHKVRDVQRSSPDPNGDNEHSALCPSSSFHSLVNICTLTPIVSTLRISSSLTRLLDKNRYAAFVFAQSWQTNGMLSQRPDVAAP